MKPYSYVFKLPSQIMTSQATTGNFAFSVLSSAGVLPLTNAKTATYSGSCGLPQFFDVAIATTFKLNDIANFNAFTSMYDAYKITRVTCNIEYLNNVSAVNSTGLMPSLFWYWDQDDATIPPTTLSIQGKQGVHRRRFTDTGVTTSARPHISINAAAPSAAPSAIVAKTQYIDCTSPDIDHYALKMMITDLYLPGTTAVLAAFRFNWTYEVSFRAPLLTA